MHTPPNSHISHNNSIQHTKRQEYIHTLSNSNISTFTNPNPNAHVNANTNANGSLYGNNNGLVNSSLHSILYQLERKISQISQLKILLSNQIISSQLHSQKSTSKQACQTAKLTHLQKSLQLTKSSFQTQTHTITQSLQKYHKSAINDTMAIINNYQTQIKKYKNYYQSQIWDLRQEIKRQYKVIAMMKQEVQDLMVLMKYNSNNNGNGNAGKFQDQADVELQDQQELQSFYNPNNSKHQLYDQDTNYNRQQQQSQNSREQNRRSSNVTSHHSHSNNNNRMNRLKLDKMPLNTDLQIIQQQTQRTLQSSERSQKCISQRNFIKIQQKQQDQEYPIQSHSHSQTKQNTTTQQNKHKLDKLDKLDRLKLHNNSEYKQSSMSISRQISISMGRQSNVQQRQQQQQQQARYAQIQLEMQLQLSEQQNQEKNGSQYKNNDPYSNQNINSKSLLQTNSNNFSHIPLTTYSQRQTNKNTQIDSQQHQYQSKQPQGIYTYHSKSSNSSKFGKNGKKCSDHLQSIFFLDEEEQELEEDQKQKQRWGQGQKQVLGMERHQAILSRNNNLISNNTYKKQRENSTKYRQHTENQPQNKSSTTPKPTHQKNIQLKNNSLIVPRTTYKQHSPTIEQDKQNDQQQSSQNFQIVSSVQISQTKSRQSLSSKYPNSNSQTSAIKQITSMSQSQRQRPQDRSQDRPKQTHPQTQKSRTININTQKKCSKTTRHPTQQQNTEYIMKKFSKMVQIGEIVSSASTPVSLCGSDYTSTSVNMNSTGGNCLNGNVSGINNGVGNYNVSGHGSGNALQQLSSNLCYQKQQRNKKNIDIHTHTHTQQKPKTKQFLEQFRRTFNKCIKSMQVSKKNSTKLAHSSSAKHYAKGSTPTNNGGCNGHGGQDKDSEVMAVGKNNSSYNLIQLSHSSNNNQNKDKEKQKQKQKEKQRERNIEYQQIHHNKSQQNLKAVDHMLRQLQNNNKFIIGNKKLQLKYDGQKRNGIRYGNGILYYSNGLCYEGQFKDGLRHGYGILKFNHIQIYNGDWRNDQIQGQGKIRNCAIINKRKTIYSSQSPLGKWISYSGQFKNSKFQGSGTLYLQGGQKFVGSFSNGYACGEGSIYRKNGEVQHGNWRNNISVQINPNIGVSRQKQRDKEKDKERLIIL